MNILSNLTGHFQGWFASKSELQNGTSSTQEVNLQSLEDRVLYSAVPVPIDLADVAEIQQGESVETYEFESIDTKFDFISNAVDGSLAVDSVDSIASLDEYTFAPGELADTEVDVPAKELVFVDTSVEDHEALVADILKNSTGRNVTIEYLDREENGVSKISSSLKFHASEGVVFDSIHVISHGSDGALALGSTELSSSNLNQFADEISSWSEFLSEDADLLIYGCDVAQTEIGEDFVDALGSLSGTDVAASDDRTGHASLRGDWEFEYVVGVVDADLIFSIDVVADWNHSLQLVDASSEAGNSANRHVAADADGNVFFAYTSSNSTISIDGEDVIAHGVTQDLSGETFAPMVVNETTQGDQHWATIAAMENGDFLVVWTSDNGTDSGVFGRMFNADGTPKTAADGFLFDGNSAYDGHEFQIDSPGSGGHDATVAMDKYGNFVVVWEALDGGNSDIYAQKFDASGAKVDAEIGVATGSSTQVNPDVAINDNGQFVIGWGQGDVKLRVYDWDGSTSSIVSSLNPLDKDIAVDINNSGWVVGAYTTDHSNDSITSIVLDPSLSDFYGIDVQPLDPGDQFNPSVVILDNNNVFVTWEGESAALSDNQGAYFSAHGYNNNGTAGDVSDDFYQVGIAETHLAQSTDIGDDQRHAAITKARGDVAVVGYTTDPDGYGVKSFAVSLNQTPDVVDSNIHRLENHDRTFSAVDFTYTDEESDTLSDIAIRTLPAGTLFYQGSEITQADIDASPDGFVIPIGNIGDLVYVQASSMQDQYGIDQDSFEYRVADGNNFSVDNATLSIDVSAQDRLWISTSDDGSASGQVPDHDDGGTLQLGGVDLSFGADTAGYWSSQFSLEKLGFDISGLHYVNESITLGSSSPMTLNEGDILFSVRSGGSIATGNVAVDGTLVNLNTPFSFGNEDVIRFRPTSSDYSTGEFELVLDMSHVASSGDSESSFGELRGFTLVESDTIIGDVSVSAGDFLFARSGGAEDSSIYLLNVDEVGELSTVADASVLIEGSEIGVDEKIDGLELIESTTTIGGITLSSGTILVSQDAGDTVGTNGIDFEDHDIFALNVIKTSLDGSAIANASVFLDGADVGLDAENSMNVDAVAILGTPDPSAPPSGSDNTIAIDEDESRAFSVADFGFNPSVDGHAFDQLVISTLPTNGRLIFQGGEVVAGQAIDVEFLNDLFFVPDADESHPTNYATFGFVVSDGFGKSNENTITVQVNAVAGDVEIFGGPDFVPVDSWSQVNDTSIGDQQGQSVAALKNGGYVVAWESNDSDTSDGDDGSNVFYQVFDQDGQKVGGEIAVDVALAGTQLKPTVAALDDGGFIIVWTASESGDAEIFAKRVNAAGVGVDVTGEAPGGTFQVNLNEVGRQFDATVASLDDGGFVVSWASGDPAVSADGFDVVARVFESNGVARDEFTVNETNLGTQREPQVVATDNGGFAIAWSDQETTDIRLASFDEFGQQMGSEQLVNIGNNVGSDQRLPAITSMGNGEVVVVWQSDIGDGDSWGVFARTMKVDGSASTSAEVPINDYTVGSQTNPTVATLDDGSVLISWDSGSPVLGEAREIIAARFDNSLNRIGDEFVLNTRSYSNQASVEIAVLTDGDIIATYTNADGDNLSGEWARGIYADRLTAGTRGLEGTAIPVEFNYELTDNDGSESVTAVSLLNVPNGASVTDGVNTVNSNSGPIDVMGWDLANLTVTPPSNSFADFTVTLQVDTVDTNGTNGSATQDVYVVVDFANEAGTYSNATANTNEDQTTTVVESALFNASQDPDTASIGTPALAVDFGYTLDPMAPPVVGGGQLTWVGTDNVNGSNIDMVFDATHVSFDDNPTSAYHGIDAALVFDGSGGGTVSSFVGGNGDLSIGMWFKPDNLSQQSALLEFGSEDNGIGIYLDGDTINFHVHSPTTVNGDTTEPYVLTASGISDTEFNHVMVVIDTEGGAFGDPTKPGLALYLNGVRHDIIADINSLPTNFNWADGSAASIGVTNGTFAHATSTSIAAFSGSIAEINIFDEPVATEAEAFRQMSQVSHNLGIETIDGQTVTVGTPITLSGSGALVTLNLDGSLTYDPNGQYDYLAPGSTPEVDVINYEISDGQGGVSTAQLEVTIQPINNVPVLGPETVTIIETTPFGTEVVDLNATDADHSESNGDFTYAIVSGNTNNVFAIDESTGQITVDQPGFLDHEVTPSYTLQVSVNDGVGGFIQSTVEVNISDVAEPQIRGTVFEDVNADGSVASDVGVEGVTVHLYKATGADTTGAIYVGQTFTDADGLYVFNELEDAVYFVVVDSKSVVAGVDYNSRSTPWNAWAEQTYAAGNALSRDGGVETFTNNAGAFFGGATGGVSDDALNIATAQHVSAISVSTADVAGIDFGFSFNVVTNVNDDTNADTSQGSLRQFIFNANAVIGANEMRFVPTVDTNATGASGDWWQQKVTEALPGITDGGTVIDGQAYEITGGERDENTVSIGDPFNGGSLTADGTVGTGADGVLGTGDESVALTATPSGTSTIAGLDAPELEIIDSGDNRFGLVVMPNDDSPVITGVEINNLSIHGFGDVDDAGANIWINGRGQTSDGLTQFQVSDVTISGNYLGFNPDSFSDPGTLGSNELSSNIVVSDADDGLIFDNVIAFASRSGIGFSGADGDGADNWTISGNFIHANAWLEQLFDGIDVGNDSDYLTVTSNLITDNYGLGIDSWNAGDFHVYDNNTITGNGMGGLETGGIRVFGNDYTVTHNVIHNNEGAGVHIVGANSDFNRDFEAATGALVSQNSFQGNSSNAIDLSASLMNGLTFDDFDADDNGFLTGAEIPSALVPDLPVLDVDSDGSLTRTEYIANSSAVLRLGDGVSENDGVLDANTGNLGLDHVHLANVSLDGNGDLVFRGAVSPAMNIDRVEVYLSVNGSGDTSSGATPEPHGEGSTYLGTLQLSDFNVEPDGTFTGLLVEPGGGWPAEVTNLGSITTLTFDANNNTSEFSNNIAVNQIPVAQTGPVINVLEEDTLSLTSSTFGFQDSTGETLASVELVTLPANGKLYFAGLEIVSPTTLSTGQLASLTYVPNADYNGPDSFDFRVSDGKDFSENVATVNLNVTPVNDAPEGSNSSTTLSEDTSYFFQETDFGFTDSLANEGDDFFEVVIASVPSSGILSLYGTTLANGDTVNVNEITDLEYIPNQDFNGTDSIRFNVVDDGGEADGGQDTDQTPNEFVFNVTPANDDPVIASGNTSIPENQESVMILQGTDIDNDTLSFSINGGADGGRFEIDTLTNELKFTVAPDFFPNEDANGDNVFEVEILVEDGNGGSSTKLLLVEITNVLQEAPVWGAPEDFDVNENLATQFVVDEATDDDGDAITYSMQNTGDASLFSFDPLNRIITFNAAPDFENPLDADGDNTYELTILAEDATGLVTPQTVTINVKPINDNAPVFGGATFDFTISENDSTAQFDLGAADADLPGDIVSFQLSGDDAALFNINSDGKLSFVSAPDFESPGDLDGDNVYELIVTASDNSGLDTPQAVTVTVDPENDHIPEFNGPTYAFDADENTTPTFDVSATDDDLPSDTITYQLAGPDASLFSVDGAGQLSFAAPFDFESPQSANSDNVYSVTVVANDGKGGVETQLVNITINEVNDNSPLFATSGPFNFTTAENSSDIFSLPANDIDTPDTNLTYTLTGDDAHLFNVDNAGNVDFINSPDFENPLDNGGDNVYEFSVTADDGRGRSTSENVTVTVTETNEHAPKFVGTNFDFNVNEETMPSFNLNAIDDDAPAQAVTYSLAGDDAALFTIGTNGRLTFNVAPDFEQPIDQGQDNTYTVDVIASDGAGGETTQTVKAQIFEVNDNTPIFVGPTTDFTVNENQTGSFSMAATDLDVPDTSLKYTLSGTDAGLFEVDHLGNVSFVDAPDFENPLDNLGDNVYELTVTASDERGRSENEDMTVTVEPVNDNKPDFGTGTFQFNVNEGSTPAMNVSATDADAPLQTITYSLSGVDASLFSIDGNGNLTFVSSPDFEIPGDADGDNVYKLNVIANDGAGETSVQPIVVQVFEVNDNDPVFVPGTTTFQIVENAESRFSVKATDADAPDTNLTYSLEGSDAHLFKVDSNGSIGFIDAPDFENPLDVGQNNVYDVTVRADDNRGRSTTHDIIVEVEPANDSAPEFNGTYTFEMDEETNRVFDVSATDADLPQQTITYTLDGTDASLFSIDSNGQLTFIADPDFENPLDRDLDNNYELVVIADDGEGEATKQFVSIDVNPVNDLTPQVTSTAFTQNENSVVAHQLTGRDGDLPGDDLTFSLSTTGTGNGLFTIDPATGELSFTAAPDFESPSDADGDNVYEVEVVVDDNEGLSSTRVVLVEVLPVNEFSPVITSNSNVVAAEGVSQVMTVTARDGDRPVEQLEFSITGGPDGAEFSIDPVTGELSFNTPPNYDTPTDSSQNNVYRVEVTVQDPDGNADSQIIRIAVDPTVNQAPEVTSNSFSQNENEMKTWMIEAADRENDGFSFGLTGSNNDNGYFELDSATGELNFIEAPDFENPTDMGNNNHYKVEVVVTDANGNSSVKAIDVEVRNVNEAATVGNDSCIITSENGQVVSTSSVFDNDQIPDNASVSISKQAAHGTVILNNDGTFIFVPDDSFEGEDEFEYEVVNGGETAAGIVILEQLSFQVPTEQSAGDAEQPTSEPEVENLVELAPAVPVQNSSSGEVDAPASSSSTSRYDYGADTISNDIEDLENGEDYLEIGSDSLGSTYVYGGVTDAELITNMSTSYIAKAVVGLSSLEDTFLAVGFWQEMDSAKQNYLVNELQIGVPAIAAASASIFTFTSIAIMARSLSGVLLTTFMTSQAWTSLDLLSVLEAADETENESIEQMVDG